MLLIVPTWVVLTLVGGGFLYERVFRYPELHKRLFIAAVALWVLWTISRMLVKVLFYCSACICEGYRAEKKLIFRMTAVLLITVGLYFISIAAMPELLGLAAVIGGASFTEVFPVVLEGNGKAHYFDEKNLRLEKLETEERGLK